MDSGLIFNFGGYALALSAGFALGLLFGQRAVGELVNLLHSIETRVVALETAASIRGATPAPTPAPTNPAPATAAAAVHS